MQYLRPKSLLNPMSKVQEKDLLYQLIINMNNHNIWNCNNYTYNICYLTTNTLMDIIVIWGSNKDKNTYRQIM